MKVYRVYFWDPDGSTWSSNKLTHTVTADLVKAHVALQKLTDAGARAGLEEFVLDEVVHEL